MYSQLIGREIDPKKEVMVSIGADESLFCTFMAYLNPGDEVIVIEPSFTPYESMIEMTGARPIFVPLRDVGAKSPSHSVSSSAHWVIDLAELESKFSARTKMMLLNTPNNPMGKVYTRQELTAIADVCIRHDVIILSDEVYEWITYPGVEHVRIGESSSDQT